MKVFYKLSLFVMAWLCLTNFSHAQSTLFFEKMGTVTSNTPIANHENNNGFDNDALTMTDGGAANAADVRRSNNLATDGANDANLWFAATTERGFAIEGIDASGYTDLYLSFMYRKEKGTELPVINVEYWDGTAYQPLAFTFDEAANDAVGWYSVDSIALPAAAQISNLNLRWAKSATTAEFRLDEVRLEGTAAATAPVAPTIASTLDGRTGVMVNTQESFSVTATANDYAGQIVKGKVILDDPAQASDITLEYTDGTNWLPLTFNANGQAEFGPATGFPLADVTSNFRITFSDAGTYDYSLAIVDAATDTLLAPATEESVTVSAPLVAPEISSTLNNRTGVETTVREEFEVSTVANDYAGQLVKVVMTLDDPTQAADMTAEYFEVNNSTWQPVTFTNGEFVYGPSTGFPLGDITSDFRVTFNAAGTYDYSLAIVDAATDTLLAPATEESVTVTAFVNPTIASTLDGRANVKVNQQETYSVSTTAGSMAGTMVKVIMQLDNPAQAADMNAEYFEVNNSTWYPVTFTNGEFVYGPSTGFSLADATSDFRVTFTAPGVYDYTMTIVDATTNQPLVAGTDESVTVAALTPPTIASTLDNRSGVETSVREEFEVSTVANDYAGQLVKVVMTLVDPTQAADITAEYFEVNNSTWQPVTFTNGEFVYGPSTGFPLGDITSDFRVTFNAAGTYDYSLAIVDAATDTLLAPATDESVTVITPLTPPTIASTLNNRTGVETSVREEFEVSTVANDYAGQLVKVVMTLDDPTQAADMTAEYFEVNNSTWQPVTFTNGEFVYGPSTGFPLGDITSDFRVTFNAAGTYDYSLAIVDAATDTLLAPATEESVTVTAFVNPTIASTLDGRANVKVNQQETYSVSTTAGSMAGTMVKAIMQLDNPAQAADMNAEYFEVNNSTWYPVVFDANGEFVYGPSTGFSLADATSDFRVTFTAPGVYDYTMTIVDATTNQPLVAGTDESVTVAALTPPTIASTLDNRSGVETSVREEFEVSTVANDYAGQLVKVVMTLDDPTQAADMTAEYFEVNNSTWQPVTFTNGEFVYGPSTGFPLGDITSDFRVTFNAAGTYDYSLAIVDAATDTLLAPATEESVTVTAFVNPTIASTLDGRANVLTTIQEMFDVTVTAGSMAGDSVHLLLTLDTPAQASDINLEYNDGTAWQAVTFNASGEFAFGPANGFALTDTTVNFRVTFDAAGTYDYSWAIADPATGTALVTATDESVTVGTFVAPTISSNLDGRANVLATVQENFTVTTTAGSLAGEMVNVKIALDDPAQRNDITLEYNDGTSWLPLTFDASGELMFGPSTGFPLADTTTDFRITFAVADTFNYAISIVDAVTGTALVSATNESVIVGAFVNPTIASDLDGRANVVATIQENFSVTATAGSMAGEMVNVLIALDNPAQRNDITLEYNDGTTWLPLTFDANGELVFGPTTGYPLADATTDFRITFDAAGTYEYSLAIIDAVTGTELVPATEESVTVGAFVAATISSDLNNRSNVLENNQELFEVTATAGSQAGEMVQIRMTLDNPALASNITLEYNDGTAWQTASFNASGEFVFGPPAAGFALADTTIDFRVTFDNDGVYEYALEIIEVTSNTALDSVSESVTVGPVGLANQLQASKISLYPNPASDLVQIDGAENATAVRVLDMAGRQVMQVALTAGEMTLDVSTLKAGLYLVQIENGKQLITKKLNVVK